MRERILLLVLLFVWSAAAVEAQTFANVLVPDGVAVDKAGNVMVFADKISSRALVTYSPAGKKTSEALFGGWTTIGSGRLLYDPVAGTTYLLYAGGGGQLYTFHPKTKAFTKIATLSTLSWSINQIVDVSTGTVGSFGGLIQPRFAAWGDVTLQRQGQTLNFYVSGVHGAFAFVGRVRMVGGKVQSARVLISSRASTAGNLNGVRGVTVTPSGTVLTTLPMNASRGLGIFDRLFAFAERADGSVVWAKVSDSDISSRGMGTDPAGNILITQTSANSTLCPYSPLLVIAADGRTYRCIGGPVLMSDAVDVASSPDGLWAYVTAFRTGRVLWYLLRN